MSDPIKVLILTADIGFGHRSTANAIAAALESEYGSQVQATIANPLDDPRVPALITDEQEDYDRMVREMPEIYRLRYQLSDTPAVGSLLEGALTVMLYRVLQELLDTLDPDVVIVTHPMYQAPLRAAIAIRARNIPWLTVVTDLGAVHRVWFNSACPRLMVPTQAVYDLAVANGIKPERLEISGIPVNPALTAPGPSKAARRQALGWNPARVTALAVGSKRVKGLEPVLHVLNHSGLPLQLVAVAGGDDDLYHAFVQTEWHGEVHYYNFVDDLPNFMRAADLIICKAGGLIVTESLAVGLPLLLVDVTPGQEEGNAQYVVAKGAGALADTPLAALETLFHWLENDGALLAERAAAAQAAGKPQAAFTVAAAAVAMAEAGPQAPAEGAGDLLPKLAEFLRRFESTAKESPPTPDAAAA